MSVAEYINSKKGYTTYRLDPEKVEHSKFGELAAKLAMLKDVKISEPQFNELNEAVSNVLTFKNDMIEGGTRFWFDSLAIQHPELCRELPKTKYQKAETVGEVIEIAVDEDGRFGPSAK